MFILVRLSHDENAQSQISVMLSGKNMLVRLLQCENVEFSMLVTPLGIDILVSPLQPSNAPLFNPVRTRDTVRTLYKHNIIF